MAHVLVVDDDPVYRLAISLMLQRAGHSTQEVLDAESALDALRASTYDIVICDEEMPGMRGRQLRRRIDPAIPFVLLTELVLADSDRRGAFDAIVSKPVSSQDLLALVDRLCGERPSDRDEVPPDAEAVRSGRTDDVAT